MPDNIRLARRALMALAVGAGAVMVAPTGAAEAQTNGCPSVGSDFDSSGPYDTTVDDTNTNTFYSPSDLGGQGCDTHPVILWGNGTGTSPAIYGPLLNHFASHGFIVAAANTANAGSGEEMLQGLDDLTQWNSDGSSRFNGRVDLDNVGATGHSQGGGGAINAGKDPRVSTTFSLQPWTANQNGLDGPQLFFAGSNDSVIPPATVQRRYQDVQGSMPAAYAELAGAGHIVAAVNGGGFRGPATAWARWHLMGDSDAQEVFVGACELCNDSDWTYEANDLLDQVEGGGSGGAGGGDAGDAGEPGDGGDADDSDAPGFDLGGGGFDLGGEGGGFDLGGFEFPGFDFPESPGDLDAGSDDAGAGDADDADADADAGAGAGDADDADAGAAGSDPAGGAGECVTATNGEHVEAGRAESSFIVVRAAGSGDMLGLESGTSSLTETSAGEWQRVMSC